jgi:hypothetical protein
MPLGIKLDVRSVALSVLKMDDWTSAPPIADGMDASWAYHLTDRMAGEMEEQSAAEMVVRPAEQWARLSGDRAAQKKAAWLDD